MSSQTVEIERDGFLIHVSAPCQLRYEPAQRDAGGRLDIPAFHYVEFGDWKDRDGNHYELTPEETETAIRAILQQRKT